MSQPDSFRKVKRFVDVRRPLLSLACGLAAVLLVTGAASDSAEGSQPHGPASDPGGLSKDEAAQLNAVSCMASGLCVAVGFSSPDDLNSRLYPLAEAGTRSKWSITTTPRVGTWSSLYGVSCLHSAFCVAVGYSGKPEGVPVTGPPVSHVLIEATRNGRNWSVVRAPSPDAHAQLRGVSCSSAAFCVAVGYAGSQVLIEEWKGESWTVSSTYGSQSGDLQAVSCTSSRTCVAVGSNGSGTLVERLEGSTWSTIPSPNESGFYSTLNGVSCATPDVCTAVGDTYVSKSVGQQPLIAQYFHGQVTIATSQSPPVGGQLNAASCRIPHRCLAVGVDFRGPDGANLAVRVDQGTWTIDPGASLPLSTQPGLQGISCVTANNCVAVGSRFSRGHYVTAVVRYQRSIWTSIVSPDPT